MTITRKGTYNARLYADHIRHVIDGKKRKGRYRRFDARAGLMF